MATAMAGVTAPVVLAAPSTQASFVDYAQCANGAPPSTSLACPGNWINGILQASNSHYHEDEVTPQRAEVEVPKGSPTTGRTLTLKYQARKGGATNGIHAYDSLTTWNLTQTAADRCQGLTAANCVGGTPTTFAVPADPTVVGPAGPGVSTITSAHQIPGVFTMYGGTITAVSVPVHDNAAGGGDDYAKITVTYSVASTAAAQKVQLLFGGHLAATNGTRGWGPGLGSSNISGGPYHITLDAADGASIGSRDNQIQASAILPQAALKIAKTADASPVSSGDPIGFTVTVTNNGTGTSTNTTLSDPLPAGSGILWSINPAYTGPGSCTVTGSPTQTLNCSFGDMPSGTSASVHVSSGTTSATSGTFTNTATAKADNNPSVTATASVTVNQPTLAITKTADASTVNVGQAVGYTITFKNNGPGNATNASISDVLPGGLGADWTISPAVNGCSISGAPPSETLVCNLGTMAPGTSVSVHVTSGTNQATPSTLANTAVGRADNSPDVQASASITVNQPSLAITKTADAASVSAGQGIGFTVTVKNSGPGTATNVALSDPLPTATGVTWSMSPAVVGCSISPTPQALTCSFGDMATNASVSVHLISPTTTATSGKLTNVATVTADNSPSKDATASVTVNQPGLTITKTADASVVSSSQDVGFTITVANTGAGAALNAGVNDPLPVATGVTWAISPSYTGPGTCTISGTPQVLNCGFGTLAAGGSVSIHVKGTTSAATSGTLTNKATATADNSPPVDATDTVTVRQPKLVLTKTADAATVSSGDPIGFAMTVTNTGAGTALNAGLTDSLPAATGVLWTISPDYTGPGTCTIGGTAPAQTLTCAFGNLTSGASATVHVSSDTTADTSGPISNTAIAKADNNPPTPGSGTVTVNKPNLGITKAAVAGTVKPGDPIGYTVVVTNAGPGAATNVTVTDPLPGAQGVDWSISPAVPGCSVGGTAPDQTLSCSFSSLAATATVTIHLTSQTTNLSCATLTNTATVQANNNAPVTSTAASIKVDCQPKLVVTKVACPASNVVPGGFLTYTLSYSNTGTAAAASTTMVDTLPSGTQVADAGGGVVAGPVGNQTVTWDLGTLAVGANGTRTLVVLVTALTGSSVTNNVTLSSAAAPAATGTASTTTAVSNAGALTHGSAYGIDANVLSLNLAHIGQVATVAPGTPQTAARQLATVEAIGVAHVDAVRQTSDSSVDTEAVSTATSTVAGVNLLSGALTADVVKGVSQSVAGPGSASTNRNGSTFTNLMINGVPQANVAPGTLFDLKVAGVVVARAVVYEEVKSSTLTGGAFKATHSLNMIHVTVLKNVLGLKPGAEVIVGHVQTDATYPSGLACGTVTSGTVSGEAFSALVANGLTTVKQGDAVLPATGGSSADQVDGLSVLGTVNGSTANDTTSGGLTPSPNATSRSVIQNANVLNGLVTADLLDVSSTSAANPDNTATTTFSTTLVNLKVAGVLVAANAAPNTTFGVPQGGGLVVVIVNEQVAGGNGTKDTEGTVNALHVIVLNGAGALQTDVIVASAHSDAHRP